MLTAATTLSIVADSFSVTTGDGDFAVNPDGWTITPDGDYNGEVSFSYSISDGTTNDEVTSTATLQVLSVNDAPVYTDAASILGNPEGEGTDPNSGNGPLDPTADLTPSGTGFTTAEDTDLTFTKSQLLTGFSDADGDTLSIAAITASWGDLSYDADTETYTYTPDSNYNG